MKDTKFNFPIVQGLTLVFHLNLCPGECHISSRGRVWEAGVSWQVGTSWPPPAPQSDMESSPRYHKNHQTLTKHSSQETLPSCQPPSPIFCSLKFRHLSVVTVSLPCFAFLFCIIYSFFHHYELVTRTHCQVWNVAPSISGTGALSHKCL